MGSNNKKLCNGHLNTKIMRDTLFSTMTFIHAYSYQSASLLCKVIDRHNLDIACVKMYVTIISQRALIDTIILFHFFFYEPGGPYPATNTHETGSEITEYVASDPGTDSSPILFFIPAPSTRWLTGSARAQDRLQLPGVISP